MQSTTSANKLAALKTRRFLDPDRRRRGELHHASPALSVLQRPLPRKPSSSTVRTRRRGLDADALLRQPRASRHRRGPAGSRTRSCTRGSHRGHDVDGLGRPLRGSAGFQGILAALSVPSEAEADRCSMRSATAGRSRCPWPSTFFSPRFGMVADRFGVVWMIVASPTT